MKRTLATIAALALYSASSVAWAQSCPAGTLRVTSGTPTAPNNGAGNLQSFIRGATVCLARGADRWQEYHGPNGDLIDYKRGPNDPMDPTKKVGTWGVTGVSPAATASPGDPRGARAPRDENATLTHTYGNLTYAFAVCVPAGQARTANPSYVLSSPTGGTFTEVRIVPGQVACP